MARFEHVFDRRATTEAGRPPCREKVSMLAFRLPDRPRRRTVEA
jgi:hypothetical protein